MLVRIISESVARALCSFLIAEGFIAPAVSLQRQSLLDGEFSPALLPAVRIDEDTVGNLHQPCRKLSALIVLTAVKIGFDECLLSNIVGFGTVAAAQGRQEPAQRRLLLTDLFNELFSCHSLLVVFPQVAQGLLRIVAGS